jgi:hypothetical protein
MEPNTKIYSPKPVKEVCKNIFISPVKNTGMHINLSTFYPKKKQARNFFEDEFDISKFNSSFERKLKEEVEKNTVTDELISILNFDSANLNNISTFELASTGLDSNESDGRSSGDKTGVNTGRNPPRAENPFSKNFELSPKLITPRKKNSN